MIVPSRSNSPRCLDPFAPTSSAARVPATRSWPAVTLVSTFSSPDGCTNPLIGTAHESLASGPGTECRVPRRRPRVSCARSLTGRPPRGEQADHRAEGDDGGDGDEPGQQAEDDTDGAV